MSVLSVRAEGEAAGPRQMRRAIAAYILGGSVALLAATQTTPPSLVLLLAGGLFVVAGVWMFRSERYEYTLAVLMVYLGVADGYLKLRTGSSVMTLGRDALLYALVLGAIIRWSVRRDLAVFPPMTGWILLFAGLVIAEIFNPGTGSLRHGLPAARPDLEFVPLYFFGYAVMRSPARIRGFLVILLVITAANGVVSLMQFSESPAQVAAWGAGYAQRINGTGGVAGRTFTTSSGKARVRPFGLQSDAGGGGNTGMLGVPAAIALLGPLRRRKKTSLLVSVLAVGTVLAIVTSEGRGALLAAFAALIAYVGLSVVSKRLAPTLAGLGAAGVVTFLVITMLSGSAGSGAFSRYATVTPGNRVNTEQGSRGSSLSDIPRYAVEYPLGAGLGSSGPAAGIGRTAIANVNGETEFTYLITEVGIFGLLVLVGFHVRMLTWSVGRIRRFGDPETRALMAALAAPLFGILALYFGGPVTTQSPMAPYLWFVSGTLVYWFTSGLRRERHDMSLPFAPFGKCA